MLRATIILFVLTIAAAVLGFRDLVPPVTRVFELLFWVFGLLFVVALNVVLFRREWSRQAGESEPEQDPGQ